MKETNVKPSPLTQRMVVIEKEIAHITERLSCMQMTLNAFSYKFESHANRLKKTQGMHATIRQCHTKMMGYNTINNKSVHFYNKVILRMREIQKDYDALFKKMGATITFFERREAGEDWIPGDPMEEREVDQTEATTSSQLQKMEEKLDDE